MNKLLIEILKTIVRISYKYWVIFALYISYEGAHDLLQPKFVSWVQWMGAFWLVAGVSVVVSEIKFIKSVNGDILTDE